MADTEMILAYLGKALGQIGSSLTPPGYPGHELGLQAAESNEGWLQDLHYKKYKKEKEKKEKKGLWGDILNLGGDVASVVFPEFAVPIQIATGAGDAALTGDTSGLVSAGLGAASSALSESKQPQGSGEEVVRGASTPEGFSMIAPAMVDEAGTSKVPQATIQTADVPVSSKDVQKVGAKERFKSGLSALIGSPQFQESVIGIANKLFAQEEPVLSTIGLNPSTAMALRDQVAAEEQRALDNAFRREELNLRRRALGAGEESAPKVIGSEPVLNSQGVPGWNVQDSLGRISFIPAPSGYTPAPSAESDVPVSPSNFVDLEGGRQGFVTRSGGVVPITSPVQVREEQPKIPPFLNPPAGSGIVVPQVDESGQITGANVIYTQPVLPDIRIREGAGPSGGGILYDQNAIPPGVELPATGVEKRAAAAIEQEKEEQRIRAIEANKKAITDAVLEGIKVPDDKMSNLLGGTAAYEKVQSFAVAYLLSRTKGIEVELEKAGRPINMQIVFNPKIVQEEGEYIIQGSIIYYPLGMEPLEYTLDISTGVPVATQYEERQEALRKKQE